MLLLGILLGGRLSGLTIASLFTKVFLMVTIFQIDELIIMQTTGKLPSDYIELTSLGGALMNMGVMGGLATIYAVLARVSGTVLKINY